MGCSIDMMTLATGAEIGTLGLYESRHGGLRNKIAATLCLLWLVLLISVQEMILRALRNQQSRLNQFIE